MLLFWRSLNLFKHVALTFTLAYCQSSHSHFTGSEFTHTTRLIYSWEPFSEFSRVIKEYKGTGVNELFELPESFPVTQVIKLSWLTSHENSCVQMSSRRSGHQESALVEAFENDVVTIAHLRVNSFNDGYKVCFKEKTGETTLAVTGSYIEPQLINQKAELNNIHSVSYIRLDLYSKEEAGANTLLSRNGTDAVFIPQSNNPHLSSSGGGGSFPFMGDDKPTKPGFVFQGSDIDMTLYGYGLGLSEQSAPGAAEGDILMEVNQEGAFYRLVLSQKEWQELVARNLHNSASVLSRLVRFQSEGRYNRSLLIEELNYVLNNHSLEEEERQKRIQSLLMEHDDIPPERIYLHSWLTSIYKQFLLESAGFELLLTDDEKRTPEIWLKKLEEVTQALVKEKKLQQAVGDKGLQHPEGESYHQDIFSGSLDQLSLFIHQRTHALWQVLLADSLASVQEVIGASTIHPTPVFLQASTGDGAKNIGSGSTHSTASSSGSNAARATPFSSSHQGGSNGLEENGEGERDKEASKQPQGDNGWQSVIQKVLSSIVRIEFQQVKSEGKISAGAYVGTGFVVDAEKGIVLTNKHLGTSRPVLARGRFHNQESIELLPLYSDPVNDFGFYQYSPTNLQSNQPQSLPLMPSEAKVGEEVMLAGCDIGERISILSGHLADLEREAAGYDFNTFYYLAALSASGGSSGSPVVNRRGEVVALNSGRLEQKGRSTAGALLLPVVQADKALRALRKGMNISRGSIQTVFNFKQIDKLSETGLSEQSRDTLAGSGCTGSLVVWNVIRQGVADEKLQNGDIVIRLNGKPGCNFDHLVDTMNTSVGQNLLLEVERNREIHTVSLPVVDAFNMDPNEIYELAGAHFHDISYRYAFAQNIPLKGVYISKVGAYFERADLINGDIIQAVNGVATPSLGDFIREMSKTKSGESIGINYIRPALSQVSQHTAVIYNQAFFPTTLFTRNYGHRYWKKTQYPAAERNPDPEAGAVCRQSEQIEVEATAEQRWNKLLVQVEITIPFPNAGRSKPVDLVGFIVDAERGFVLVDNMKLVTTFADIRLIFFGAREVSAVVYKQHPKQSMAILKYDTSDIDFQVESNELVDEAFYSGQKLRVVGLNSYGNLKITENQLSCPFMTYQPMRSAHLRPKDQAEKNQQPLRREIVDTCYKSDTYSGFLVNKNDEVVGINTFPFGTDPIIISARQISKFIEQIKSGVGSINDLGIGVDHIPSHVARRHGVSTKWLKRRSENQKSFMEVAEVDLTAPAADVLKVGDIILSINSQPVYEYADLEALIEENTEEGVKLDICLLRSGQEYQFSTTTTKYSFEEFAQIVRWQGMTVHEPLWDYKKICKFENSRVFISEVSPGSPSMRARASESTIVEEVDEIPTPDINAFRTAVVKVVDKDIVKVKIRNVHNGVVLNIDVRQDYFYWPTSVYSREKSGHWSMSDK